MGCLFLLEGETMAEDFTAKRAELRKKLMQIRTMMMIGPEKRAENLTEYQKLKTQLDETKEELARLNYDEANQKEGKRLW